MNEFRWHEMKNRDIPHVENLLRDMENDCVAACGRFLIREASNSTDPVWLLSRNKEELLALLMSSRSTLIPVLCGIREIPDTKFLKSFFRKKRIHSVQGLKDEVLVFENALEKMDIFTSDVFDYDLMSLDSLPLQKERLSIFKNVVLRVPQPVDLDQIAPLQAAYEQEEVIPRGSVFSPAASRINLSKIITGGKILAAEIEGRIVGKINISAVSFTRYQVGGVYVHPDFRGKGIARFMAAEFITSLINEGRGVTLFVKKNNAPARRLYLGLGFKTRDDYRIAYY